MDKSFFEDAGTRAGIIAGNILYEEMWTKCLRAKTSDEKVAIAKALNEIWDIRENYFELRKYKAQLNVNGGTA